MALVGIDGFSPMLLDEYLEHGELPALQAILRSGVRVPLVSTLPATTPVAWATILTGAPPAVTGIEGFLVHCPGDRLDERVSGCYSYRCRAEPLWETATLSGKRAIVVKFPLSYPSSTASLRIDGAAGWGGLRCLHEVASTAVVDSSTPRSRLERCDAKDVVWRWRIPTLWNGGDLVFHASLVEAEGGVSVHLCIGDREICALRVGEWSDALVVNAPARRGAADCSFRVKILAACARTPHLRLFHTALHERVGHAEPAVVWAKYLDQVGPIEEQTEPSLVFHAGLDLETQLEVFRLNASWLQNVSAALLTGEEWDLFLVQIHLVDWAHHLFHGAIDPRHPKYDAVMAGSYRAMLLQAYRLADSLVGAVASVLPPVADLVVVGDHGQDLQHSTFRVNEWLAQRGLLTWAEAEGDSTTVDWMFTSAYATGNYIHLNVVGREPTGCVDPRQRDTLRDRIIEGLLAMVDPATDARIVLIAGDKCEFEMLGANGAGVGDIVFCMRSGYQATNGRGPVLSPTVPLAEFTSGHDHFWPLDPRIHTRMLATGPRFREGYEHPRLAHLCDVAPTLAAALGIRPPRHATGHVLTDVLREHSSETVMESTDLGQRETG
ncbi:MAG: alkaline phosphatase family protein [Deltaproteobacteria bacterium]|nr:alkaline phosphatase family protein [Deltaproteobacteria bacterium]